MLQYPLFIDGESCETSELFDVNNPATGKPFAQSSLGNVATLNKAVAAAKEAFPAWSSLSDEERTAAINNIASLLEQNMPELMELVSKETGKPMNGLNGVGAGMEVGAAIAWTQVTASFSIPVDVIQDDDVARVEVHRKPLGVVGSITPWNWPLMIAIWHVIPALKSGNTVVIKPSPLTPVATQRFVELANTVLPKGVLNVVTGGAEVGTALSNHSDISKIVFTGSTPTGKAIMQSAAGNLKRLTLELGGNDAGIILPDVNVEAIANKLFTAAFHNNGQTCACLKRLYVHDSIYDEVCEALVAQANSVIVGDGLNPESQLGPLQNPVQLSIVEELVDDALKNGGKLLAGGKRIEGEGYFFQPTLISEVSDGVRLVDEEQFGPALPIIRYSDLNEVIARVNRNEAGLGGSVWTNDMDQAASLAKKMETGSVWINDHGAIQPNAPFGGVKQSGIGVEFGEYGLEEYTSLQTIKFCK